MANKVGGFISNAVGSITKRDAVAFGLGMATEAVTHVGEKTIRSGLGYVNKGLDKLDDMRKKATSETGTK